MPSLFGLLSKTRNGPENTPLSLKASGSAEPEPQISAAQAQAQAERMKANFQALMTFAGRFNLTGSPMTVPIFTLISRELASKTDDDLRADLGALRSLLDQLETINLAEPFRPVPDENRAENDNSGEDGQRKEYLRSETLAVSA